MQADAILTAVVLTALLILAGAVVVVALCLFHLLRGLDDGLDVLRQLTRSVQSHERR
jgi:hypothetical protein